jgi:hypothetical protein
LLQTKTHWADAWEATEKAMISAKSQLQVFENGVEFDFLMRLRKNFV